MVPQRFALVGGILFLALGIISLIPTLSVIPPEGLPPLQIETSYGLFLNMFAMNIINKMALIVFGLIGIFAYSRPTTSLPMSISFARTVFAVMGTLSILGMFPQTNTLAGYWPLFGHQVWFYGICSLVGAYFAYALPAKASNENRKHHHPRRHAH